MSEAALAKADDEQSPLIIGRYALFDALASGGMATVHLGRLLGPEGFGRTVAVKRLHAHFTTDPEFVTMFMDEVRIVARIRHPNVVAMVDVLESSRGLFLVMEYIHGESLSKLIRTLRTAGAPFPVRIAGAILHGVLLGLHAAHETRGAAGEMLDVIHRDVSPQNIIVGVDGVARVLDFGVAKAAGRAQVTREGQIKGKLAYMAPEQIRGKGDRRADVFAAAVVFWEALTGRRLHEGSRDVEIVTRVVKGGFPRPSELRPDVSPELDAIVMRGLAIDPDERYATARDMALDIEHVIGPVSPSEIGPWVESLSPDALRARAERVTAMEKAASALAPEGFATGPHSPADVPASNARLAIPGYLPDPSESSMRALAAGARPVEERRTNLTPLILLVAFCAALALVGVVLGAWALRARALPPAPAAKPSALPSAVHVPPPVRIEATPVPSPEPGRTANGEPSAPSASVSAARAPVSVPRAAAPKNCDPPYTTDEAGHKHYKLQCLDN